MSNSGIQRKVDVRIENEDIEAGKSNSKSVSSGGG
jgi:hypothetical protein